MAILIQASAGTRKAWGLFTGYSLFLDILIILITLVLLPFAAANVGQAVSNYVDDTYGATNSPSEWQFAVIMFCLNIVTPIVTLIKSGIHLYLFSSSPRSLRPAVVVLTSSALVSAWIVVLSYWIQWGPEGKWAEIMYPRPHSRHINVSYSVHLNMVIYGYSLAILHGLYILLAFVAYDINKRNRAGSVVGTTQSQGGPDEHDRGPRYEDSPRPSAEDEEASPSAAAAGGQTQESRPLLRGTA